MSRNRWNLKTLAAAAACLALCLILPLLTGGIPQIGNALSPMHIPVLLCGFLCGPFYAALVGLAAPPLRFLLFTMPPLMPLGLAMCLELAAYGLVSGLLYRALSKRTVYVPLLLAMLTGRLVWGAAMALLSGAAGAPFTWEAFLSGALLGALPGIAIQLILIPAVVWAVERKGVVLRDKE